MVMAQIFAQRTPLIVGRLVQNFLTFFVYLNRFFSSILKDNLNVYKIDIYLLSVF